jgi:transposase
MPRHHPVDVRRQACERMVAGEPVADVAENLGISVSTLQKWKRQALIDAGRRPGAMSYEVDPLQQARRRIKELENELTIVKAASALFDEEEPPSPKGSTRSFES